MLKVIRAKLHGIRVTGADLSYHGSVTLDPEQCKLAGIYPLEFVYIWNKNTGARISTYVIYGERGSRCCILNGAAARTCQPGDEVIITACEYINDKMELYSLKPTVLTYNSDNSVAECLHYSVFETDDEEFNFEVK
jgi:aspartate 1-decarboxylase